MTRYVQGPRHARRGPHRGILPAMAALTIALAVLVAMITWVVS